MAKGTKPTKTTKAAKAEVFDRTNPEYDAGRRSGTRNRRNHTLANKVVELDDIVPTEAEGRSAAYIAGYRDGYGQRLTRGRPQVVQISVPDGDTPLLNTLREVQYKAMDMWGDRWLQGLATAITEQRGEDQPPCMYQSIQRIFAKGSCSARLILELEAIKFKRKKKA